jgi:DNA polymerase III subunit epsilon
VTLPLARQATFEELGTPLRAVTFVVVDLETTGGSPADAEITEVGAVKVRGGEVLDEFATLVNPRVGIPPLISVLTGITDAMVAEAPALASVLPAFLEFAHGSVLVAHNAPFDLGFLRAACHRLDRPWPGHEAVDTVRLARAILTRDEATDCRLATLARVFRAGTQPCHRALADARATVDVLHGLLARVGNLGVQSLEELRTVCTQVTPEQRRKRHLADHLPHAPGVYVFRDDWGQPLYVGTSKDLRSRVRSYFTAAEQRPRMAEMVGLAGSVDGIPCVHALEAEVRELRLLAGLKPRYNRRSRFPERACWLRLTDETFPRLAIAREVRDDDATYLGPFGSRRLAEAAREALHDAVPLRSCTERLSLRVHRGACALAGMGRCGAPCEGRQTPAQYAVHVAAVRAAIAGDPRPVLAAVQGRLDRLVARERYEEAATVRDRLAVFVRAAARQQRLAGLAECQLLVAAGPADGGGWELSVVRFGRLAAAGRVPLGADPRPYVEDLVGGAEAVEAGPGPTGAATAEEMECILRWLATPGSRLVRLEGRWCSPAYGAGGLTHRFPAPAVASLAPQRRLRPRHRPARPPPGSVGRRGGPT